MDQRYQKPPPPKPNIKHLHFYLIDARPTARMVNDDAEGTEQRRVEAVNALRQNLPAQDVVVGRGTEPNQCVMTVTFITRHYE